MHLQVEQLVVFYAQMCNFIIGQVVGMSSALLC